MNRHAIYALTLSMLIGIGATSCTKYNEVDPPRTDQKSTDELPLPTHTISQLKALYKRGGTLIDKPIVVSAVIASDAFPVALASRWRPNTTNAMISAEVSKNRGPPANN